MHNPPSIVSAIISNLDPQIARGPDGIPEIVLTKYPDEAAIFSKLYNKCPAGSCFPAVPVFKKTRDLLGSYLYM